MNANDDITRLFSNIDSYLYKYTQEAREKTSEKYGTDEKVHLGVMAQELLKNPLTESSVIETEEGILAIDTKQLTAVLCAVVSNLCKEIEEIKGKIGE